MNEGEAEVHEYNKLFTEELDVAVKQQKNTALKEDTIHPKIIEILPPETKMYIYNRIWIESKIPNSWKSTVITPLLKEEKDLKDVRTKDQYP